MVTSHKLLPGRESVQRPWLDDFYSRKITDVVSPADCLSLGDSVGWQSVGSQVAIIEPWYGNAIAPLPWFGSVFPDYTFGISRRHAGGSNMAFLDGHVEHGSLRDWTLPVSAVWDRWHHRNQWPVEDFQDLPADNWAPLYGADKFSPETSVDFDFGDVKVKDCVAGNSGKGKRKQALSS